MKAQQVSALGRKTVAEVKGGTYNQASNQNHESQGRLEKRGSQCGTPQPTKKRTGDVHISQKLLVEASRSETPKQPYDRKEQVQWNN